MRQGQILKVRDLANYLGVASITIYRLTEKGEIPGHKVLANYDLSSKRLIAG